MSPENFEALKHVVSMIESDHLRLGPFNPCETCMKGIEVLREVVDQIEVTPT